MQPWMQRQRYATTCHNRHDGCKRKNCFYFSSSRLSQRSLWFIVHYVQEARRPWLWKHPRQICWTPSLPGSPYYSAQARCFIYCALKYFNNVGCARGTSTVHEFVLCHVQFVFREQTFNPVKRTEAMFGIEKFGILIKFILKHWATVMLSF